MPKDFRFLDFKLSVQVAADSIRVYCIRVFQTSAFPECCRPQSCLLHFLLSHIGLRKAQNMCLDHLLLQCCTSTIVRTLGRFEARHGDKY